MRRSLHAVCLFVRSLIHASFLLVFTPNYMHQVITIISPPFHTYSLCWSYCTPNHENQTSLLASLIETNMTNTLDNNSTILNSWRRKSLPHLSTTVSWILRDEIRLYRTRRISYRVVMLFAAIASREMLISRNLHHDSISTTPRSLHYS